MEDNALKKDTTLLEAVRELEKAVEQLAQALEINIPKPMEVTPSPSYAVCVGVTERKMQDVICRLGEMRLQVVDYTNSVGRLIKSIGK